MSFSGKNPTPPEGFEPQHFAPKGQAPKVQPSSKTSEAMKALEEKRQKKRRNRSIKIIIIALIVLIFAGIGIYMFSQQVLSNTIAEQAPTDDVVQGEFVKTISNSGTIAPLQNQLVSPALSGTVIEVNVRPGDTVKKGDVLFTFESPEMQSAIDAAEIGVKQAKEGVKQAQQGVKSAVAGYNAAVDQYNYSLQQQIDARDQAIQQQFAALDAQAMAQAQAVAQQT
ncbi:MAG: biotin/lipoyl-binding protein, partial [Coriobacteriia bacterium]|nr:biotin/lipoyl-binding protein [Coriobacteriia bacterium]